MQFPKLSIAGALLFGAAIALPSLNSQAAVTFDAGRDLLANEVTANEAINPNSTVPQWSYAYRATATADGAGQPIGTLFTALDHVNGSPFQGYADHNGSCCGALPELFVNAGATSVGDPSGAIAPGEILIHPDGGAGSSEQKVVVRFTALAANAGTYHVTALWEDLNACCTEGAGVDIHVVLNQGGTSADLFANHAISREDDALPTSDAFSQDITLGVGDSIDFLIGSNGVLFGDSTRFNATLDLVPEPASLSLLALAGSALLTRRRHR